MRHIKPISLESKIELLEEDIELFRTAVADVALSSPVDRVYFSPPKPSPYPVQTRLDDEQVLVDSLSDHDLWEAGFESGEELSFLRQSMPSTTLKKLRRGHWITQGELDLHGLVVAEAKIRLIEFLNFAFTQHYRCIRIIHGKGLGSVNREPVLKRKVAAWLSQRDEVLAFCQARSIDGGGGAVVVLLKLRKMR